MGDILFVCHLDKQAELDGYFRTNFKVFDS